MKKSAAHAYDILTVLAQARNVSNTEAPKAAGSIIPAIEVTSTYRRNAAYRLGESGEYRRDDNPNYRHVEEVMTAIEKGRDALVFSSGMAAAAAIIATLRPGDHIVAPKTGYYGIRRWIENYCAQYNVGFALFNPGLTGGLEHAIIKGKTKIVWIETHANPSWEITDIEVAATIAHRAGARLVVDSTVMTPILCNPICYGADIVMHSASKYLNGHSDVIAGALVTAKDDHWWGEIKQYRYMGGAILGSLEAWLLLRGLRTMGLRVARSCQNAMAIARYFNGHRALEQVLYPGLATHAGHNIAKAQLNAEIGYGGMVSLCVNGGGKAALRLATSTELFMPATSLGGVESLIEHRATIEGEDTPVPDNLVRLSVGIESAGDLIADLEQGLVSAVKA